MRDFKYSTLMMGMIAFYVTGCNKETEEALSKAQESAALSANTEQSSKIEVPDSAYSRIDIAGELYFDQYTLTGYGIKSNSELRISGYKLVTSKYKDVTDATISKVNDTNGLIQELGINISTMGIYWLTLEFVNQDGDTASHKFKVFQTLAGSGSGSYDLDLVVDKEGVAMILAADLSKAKLIGEVKSVRSYNAKTGLVLKDAKGSVVPDAGYGEADRDKDGGRDFLFKPDSSAVSGSIEVLLTDKTTKTVTFSLTFEKK